MWVWDGAAEAASSAASLLQRKMNAALTVTSWRSNQLHRRRSNPLIHCSIQFAGGGALLALRASDIWSSERFWQRGAPDFNNWLMPAGLVSAGTRNGHGWVRVPKSWTDSGSGEKVWPESRAADRMLFHHNHLDTWHEKTFYFTLTQSDATRLHQIYCEVNETGLTKKIKNCSGVLSLVSSEQSLFNRHHWTPQIQLEPIKSDLLALTLFK